MPSQISDSEAEDVYQCCLEWSALTGREYGRQTEHMPLANVETEVPMILKDTSAVLIRMALVMIQKSPSCGKFGISGVLLWDKRPCHF